ncbi:MAG: hypothetical protein M3430_01695 [Acidobacteriota bacterium]|nr:hypothetical protein [Acidobacteriota bacterium]
MDDPRKDVINENKVVDDDPANIDPLSGEPGAHPISTAGGTAGGAIAGATIGTIVGGPVGTVVGGVIGGVAGALGGHELGEAVNPTDPEAAQAVRDEKNRTRE